MLSPGQHPLTDGGSGRISMPFLPTLAVVVALAAASAFCPSTERAASAPPDIAAAAPSATAFAESAAPAAVAVAAPPRLPASLAFAEAFPTLSPSVTGALHAAARTHTAQRLAASVKRSCPGRGCPEVPHRAAVLPPGDGDPLAAARADGAGDVAEDGFLPPLALPFAAAQASMVRTLAPAARLVGQAADLMRGGGAAVKGSVVHLAACLP